MIPDTRNCFKLPRFTASLSESSSITSENPDNSDTDTMEHPNSAQSPMPIPDQSTSPMHNHRSPLNPPSPYKGDPNPTKWLIKLKIYFMVNPQFTEEDKVLVAMGLLEDHAFNWMKDRMMDRGMEVPFHTMQELGSELVSYFEIVTDQQSAENQLANLTQTGTVQEYERQFMEIVLRIRDFSDAEKRRAFMRGLKPSTLNEVIRLNKQSFNEVRQDALLFDQTNYIMRQTSRASQPRQSYAPRPQYQPRPYYQPRPQFQPRPQYYPRPQYQPRPQRNPDAMEVDAVNFGTLRRGPLTDNEREYLRNNYGCFACRQLGHISFNCPNRLNPAPNYAARPTNPRARPAINNIDTPNDDQEAVAEQSDFPSDQ